MSNSFRNIFNNYPDASGFVRGGITDIQAGTGINIDKSNPEYPIIQLSSASQQPLLALTAGDNITIEYTQPQAPTINAPSSNFGVLGVVAGDGIQIDNIDPQHPTISTVGGVGGSLWQTGTITANSKTEPIIYPKEQDAQTPRTPFMTSLMLMNNLTPAQMDSVYTLQTTSVNDDPTKEAGLVVAHYKSDGTTITDGPNIQAEFTDQGDFHAVGKVFQDSQSSIPVSNIYKDPLLDEAITGDKLEYDQRFESETIIDCPHTGTFTWTTQPTDSITNTIEFEYIGATSESYGIRFTYTTDNVLGIQLLHVSEDGQTVQTSWIMQNNNWNTSAQSLVPFTTSQRSRVMYQTGSQFEELADVLKLFTIKAPDTIIDCEYLYKHQTGIFNTNTDGSITASNSKGNEWHFDLGSPAMNISGLASDGIQTFTATLRNPCAAKLWGASANYIGNIRKSAEIRCGAGPMGSYP
jgi:hypothetical protein